MRIVIAMVALASAILTGPTAGAATESVIYTFTGNRDGASPQSGLIADTVGNLYGTTKAGGSAANCTGGCGVVFELSRPKASGGKWTETVLHRFNGGSGGGQAPLAGLIFDAQGALYGTTVAGGSAKCTGGCGIVFKLTPPAAPGKPWTESILHAFTGGADGQAPLSGLTLATDGTLYGTTGQYPDTPTSTCIGSPCGTVFALMPPAQGRKSWTKALLHSFKGGTDGSLPVGALVIGKDGALYGTTALGGSTHCITFGCGIVFKLTPPAAGAAKIWTEQVIYVFQGNQFLGGTLDGAYPSSDLTMGVGGRLTGTTYIGGDAGNIGGFGTIFRLTPPTGAGAGAETVLYRFPNEKSGSNPTTGRLIAGADGMLYGTTPEGGTAPKCTTLCGTVYKLTPPATTGGQWSRTILYAFKGGTDGSGPQAGLTGLRGAFYGTTSAGGTNNVGTVFELKP